MEYTYDDFCNALLMIGKGIVILLACLASFIINSVFLLIQMIIVHPLKVIEAVGIVAAIVLFVPTMVQLAWALDSMTH